MYVCMYVYTCIYIYIHIHSSHRWHRLRERERERERETIHERTIKLPRGGVRRGIRTCSQDSRLLPCIQQTLARLEQVPLNNIPIYIYIYVYIYVYIYIYLCISHHRRLWTWHGSFWSCREPCEASYVNAYQALIALSWVFVWHKPWSSQTGPLLRLPNNSSPTCLPCIALSNLLYIV